MRRALAVAVLSALAVVTPHAQLRGVKADITPVVGVSAHPGGTVRAALVVKLPEGYHVQSNKPRDPLLIPTVLTLDPPAGIAVNEIVYPPSVDATLVGSDQPLAVFERQFAIGVEFTLASTLPLGGHSVPARLRYQSCNDTTCFAPVTAPVQLSLAIVSQTTKEEAGADRAVLDTIKWGHGEKPGQSAAPVVPAGGAAPASGSGDLAKLEAFVVAGTTGGYQGSGDFLRFIHDAESGVQRRGLFEGRGPLAILLIVLLGGLALNLTPCVLPMIPINLAVIGAGAQAQSRSRGFWLGAAYGGAMAIVYGILGLVVILTAGTFGTINASPWFNLGIAVLFVVLALAMFDVLIIDFSRFSSSFNPQASKGSFVLAFSMGAVAALLAGACVAPVVIEVVLFSSNLYSTGTRVALALPFFLGVGMAIPWPIAGAGIASMPKPGMWMVRVKQVFGVVILATAAYYGYEAYSLFSNRWVDASAVASSVEEKLKSGWHASLAEGLDVATREQKPVLIDFWATWCKNCLTMDKTTMENAAVVAALNNYVKIKYQAEDPDASPAKDVMERFHAIGLPTYVILKPKTRS